MPVGLQQTKYYFAAVRVYLSNIYTRIFISYKLQLLAQRYFMIYLTANHFQTRQAGKTWILFCFACSPAEGKKMI